ncbi:MAG: ribonuclease D [Pseudomonadales bacterium]|nr:ribonuclease D [Pseudomonadales bacterium]
MQILPIIDTDQALNDYCKVLASRDAIALDTEFLRVSTFFPKPGLFQINDGENIALIDPLAIDDWLAFSAVMADVSIVKVLHACDEDIELLHHFLKVEVVNVFDTQVAAAFCGYDFCMGYQRLVAAMFNEDIEKGESRSDWMQRPLSESQVRYAANDVVYLLDMHSRLKQKLQNAGHEGLVKQECDAVFGAISNDDFSLAFKRVRQAWKLNAQQFARVKALACWREEKMRSDDLPRNKIAKNEALMVLAVKSQWHKNSLSKVDGLPAATTQRFSDELLQILTCEYEGETQVMPRPIKAESLLNRLKAAVKAVAEKDGIAEQMISKKVYNEALFSVYRARKSALQPEDVTAIVTCWRQPFYLQAMQDLSSNS